MSNFLLSNRFSCSHTSLCLCHLHLLLRCVCFGIVKKNKFCVYFLVLGIFDGHIFKTEPVHTIIVSYLRQTFVVSFQPFFLAILRSIIFRHLKHSSLCYEHSITRGFFILLHMPMDFLNSSTKDT